MTAENPVAPARFTPVDEMRDAVFFEGTEAGRRLSRFWLLLVLSSIIAAAGVVADSTATVIGAMIVAPLMTPILGTMLATVIGDRANLLRSVALVLAGAAAAIAIGFAIGLTVSTDVLAPTNSQVAARVSPRLIDLLAALATGVVGSIALVRRDIADTLPGVAIAISLVPPLSVAGLALESGSVPQMLGALLLFATNVVAILCTGIVVMSVYGVTRLSHDATPRRTSLRRPALLLSVMAVVIVIPLGATSYTIAADTIREQRIQTIAGEWAVGHGWTVTGIQRRGDDTHVAAEGPLPLPETAALKDALLDAGVDIDAIVVDLTPAASITLAD